MRLEKELRNDLDKVAAEVARWLRWKRSLQTCSCLREGILDDGKHPVRGCPKCGGSGLYLPEN